MISEFGCSISNLDKGAITQQWGANIFTSLFDVGIQHSILKLQMAQHHR